jgi:hypothetical protein
MDFFSEIADAGSTEDVAEELARVARCSELFSKDGAASLQGRKRLIKAGMVFYGKLAARQGFGTIGEGVCAMEHAETSQCQPAVASCAGVAVAVQTREASSAPARPC